MLDSMDARPLQTDDLETPVGVVNLDRVRANLRRVSDYAARHGLAWRPHVKTHKSLEIARMQLAAGAKGLTVATLHEGEVMCRVTNDLLLAYPPIGAAKLRRLGVLLERSRLKVALDSLEALRGVEEVGRAVGRPVEILVEVDLGMRRVGVGSPAATAALAAAAEEGGGSRFLGILFYPGHIRDPLERQDAAIGELSERLALLLEVLEQKGLAPEVVSGGSTPTLWRSHEMTGVTEIRPGTCVFHDRDMIEIGICTEAEVAYHVHATVVSTAVPGQAVIDAGAKALSKEVFRGGGEGYAVVMGRPEVLVARLSEEHGVLDLSRTEWRPRIGERVRIVPNHVCVSVNLQDRLYAEEGERLRPIQLEGRGRGP